MTTVFNAPPVYVKIDTSPYRETLENIAPNITILIGSTATVDESWWDTLSRILPGINSTPQQDSELTAIATRAASGLLPVGYVGPPVVNNNPLTAEKFLTYASVAAVLWRVFF